MVFRFLKANMDVLLVDLLFRIIATRCNRTEGGQVKDDDERSFEGNLGAFVVKQASVFLTSLFFRFAVLRTFRMICVALLGDHNRHLSNFGFSLPRTLLSAAVTSRG